VVLRVSRQAGRRRILPDARVRVRHTRLDSPSPRWIR
jgi:hypothetical protein